jgi:hypothetical protein
MLNRGILGKNFRLKNLTSIKVGTQGVQKENL